MRKKSIQYFQAVEDHMGLVCRYLPDGTLTFANRAYCRHYNKNLKELIGQSFLPSVHPKDRRDLIKFIKLATPKNPQSIQIQQIIKSNGETFWVEWRRWALFDDSGNLQEIQSVGRDVTEYKKTEKALKATEKDLRRKNIELARKNNALTEILERLEHQKLRIKDDVITNINEFLIPLVDQLIAKGSRIDTKYLNLLKRALEDLTSSFGRKITLKSYKLTPRELQICHMIKRELSSKEIAHLLNISPFTVARHRHNIRRKLRIIKEPVNLVICMQDL